MIVKLSSTPCALTVSILLIGSILATGTGCSSWSTNPQACSHIPSYSWFTRTGGALLQGRPCAVVDSLAWESGSEVRESYEYLVSAARTEGSLLDTRIFSANMGCPANRDEDFNKMVSENRKIIFGENFDHSKIQVVRETRKLLRANDDLRIACGEPK